jgi:cell division protein FtsW
MSLFSRTDRSFLGQWWWTVDRGLLGAFITLMLIGVLLVTTASPPVAEHLGLDPYHFLKRHIMMLVPSVFILLGVSMLEPRQIWRAASILLGGSVIAMILVLFTGMEIKGAQRWLHILGLSVQPSEFAKPALAIAAGWFMGLQKQHPKFPGQKIASGLYAAVISLLLMQPDLGMTVVVVFIWMTQVFLAGFPFRLIIGLGAVGLGGVVAAYFTFDHVYSRINRFLFPESGDNYQVDRSIEAFQNGGLFGSGPGQGTVKLSLPDAHADFIFAVAGEEMGLIFVVLLMAVFGFVLLRGYNRLIDTDAMFPILAAGGLLAMFGLQTLIHMGSALNVLPAKGMTLPFISYGGSSMLAMAFAMGAVLALTRKKSRVSVSRSGISLKSGENELQSPP